MSESKQFTEILAMVLDKYLWGTAAITLVVLVAVLGQFVFTRSLGKEKVETYHEVGGYYMSVVGTLYSVVLGLIVYDAMGNFQAAKSHVEKEATAWMELYTYADRMPRSQGQKIRSHAKAYINEVINREWQYMRSGHRSERARAIMLDISNEALMIEPVTENQKALYPSMMSSLKAIWENRRARINFAEFGIPGVEWVALLLGACITIIFTYFFFMSDHRTQLFMTSLVTLIVAINLYLVLLFGRPYSGDLHVTTNSFDLVQEYINSNP